MAKKTFKKELLKVGVIAHPQAPSQMINIDKPFLQKLVDNFKTSPFAPVIRGHDEAAAEKDTSLIVSKNTKGLSLEGDSLFAELEIEEAELDKYNDVSVGMKLGDKKGLGPILKHIAMTVNPHIKGLQPFVQLSDVDEDLLTLNLSDITDMEEKKVEEVIEASPETPPTEVVEEVKAEDPTTDTEVIKEEAKEEVATEEAKVEEVKTEEVVEPEVKEEKVELSDVEKYKAEILRLNELRASDLREKNTLEADVKFSDLLREGKVFPVQKAAFVALYSAPEVMVEFSDSEEKIGIRAAFDKFIESMPKVVNLSDVGVVVDEEVADARPFYVEYRTAKPEMSDEDYAKHYEENKEFIIEEMEVKV